VWEINRPSDAPLHPTMKPLPLMERAIANSSKAGDLVLDQFAGSGSTLVACERTGRRCAALELDPRCRPPGVPMGVPISAGLWREPVK
jgi:DNA modification methylase